VKPLKSNTNRTLVRSGLLFFLLTYVSLAFSAVELRSDTLASMTSYFPQKNLVEFIVEHLDITTFSNSLNPQHVVGRRHFNQLGFKKKKLSENSVEFLTPEWIYKFEVIKREDVNWDGIEYVLICYSEISNTSVSQQALTLTRYSPDAYVIAIPLLFSLNECPSLDSEKSRYSPFR
jgi:hypothetical protein